MKFICIAAMAIFCYSCNRKMAATASSRTSISYIDGNGNKVLLGIQQKESLEQSPFSNWFNKNYADYTIDSVTANQLKPLLKNKSFEIFLGTWCGDSKRETPRMLKLLAYAGVPADDIKLIMVDNRDSMYKQSPGHEEKGKSIHRVPSLLVYENDKEINRIVESPVVSLEKDLLSIVASTGYEPHYKAATYLMQLTSTNNIAAVAKDTTALAEKLKGWTHSSAELNSLGYVWMAAGEMDKALLALQLNARLYPDVANVYDSLGAINLKMNNKEVARKYYSKVLSMQPGNTNAARMLTLLQ